jgi:hypothetical protein
LGLGPKPQNPNPQSPNPHFSFFFSFLAKDLLFNIKLFHDIKYIKIIYQLI